MLLEDDNQRQDGAIMIIIIHNDTFVRVLFPLYHSSYQVVVVFYLFIFFITTQRAILYPFAVSSCLGLNSLSLLSKLIRQNHKEA